MSVGLGLMFDMFTTAMSTYNLSFDELNSILKSCVTGIFLMTQK